MGQFRDALDKQFPPKTDEQRAAYYAVRRHLEVRTPAWQWIAAGSALLFAASLLYASSVSATPFVAPLSAASAVAQRNNEAKPAPEVWKDGPCKGKVRGTCVWYVNGVAHQ